ncbi:hypothetical protein ACI2LJ_32845 [Streptomyces sp. NPDC088090]|uniref:hypothetical protein n=1 Tax=Streptomyces sp. NPDC088090 TaxID=3365822 RepID=UPI00384B8A6B
MADHVLLLRATTTPSAVWNAAAVTATLCRTTTWRVTRHRTPAYDHRTHRLFEYWYTVILAAALLTL